MEKFLMICYVAADFHSPDGDSFVISPNQIGVFVEAPVWVKDTLLFKWLLIDGSVRVAEQDISMKQGENDPMQGVAADGKDEKIAETAEAEIVEAVAEEEEKPVAKKPRTRKTKKDDAE